MTDPAPSNDVHRARRAFLIVGLVVPLVLAVIGIASIVAWLPELPTTVATHWSLDGPDGFGSPTTFLWAQVALGIGAPVLLTLPVLLTERATWGATARFLGGLSLGLGLFSAVLTTGSVVMQRGLDDAMNAPDIAPLMGAAFAVLVIGTVAGWFVQPAVSLTSAVIAVAPDARIRREAGERAAWFGTATAGRTALVVIAVTTLAAVAAAGWFLLLGEQAGWILAAVALLLTALSAATLAFRVRVTADGLHVRSLLGWPRTRIPLDEVRSIGVVKVDPLGDFGGWGWRLGLDGRQGIILRAGDALQVERRAGRTLVVTVDDAGTAAAVLGALARTDAHTPGSPTPEEQS